MRRISNNVFGPFTILRKSIIFVGYQAIAVDIGIGLSIDREVYSLAYADLHSIENSAVTYGESPNINGSVRNMW